MKLFIYCFRPYDEKKAFDEICKKRNITYDFTENNPTLENAFLAQGYDAISITPTSINKELIKTFYQMGIKAILNRSIGVDHIDLIAAKDFGICVSHVNYPPEAVADYAIMMMMMSLRKINLILEDVKIQDYTLEGKLGKSLSDCTVGVIGTGRIGKTVIQRLAGFGCKIIAFDNHINQEIKDICEYTTLQKIYEQSDVITLHIPATSENKHLINKQAFDKMKNDTILVNTARGTLINTNDLIDTLEENTLGGVALDVLEDEDGLYYFDRKGKNISNRQFGLLRSFPNVIITPHTAFYTDHSVYCMVKETIDCFVDLLEGHSNKQFIIL